MAVTSDPTGHPSRPPRSTAPQRSTGWPGPPPSTHGWYGDADHHRQELAAVFRAGWSCVGVIDDVAPGGWMAATRRRRARGRHPLGRGRAQGLPQRVPAPGRARGRRVRDRPRAALPVPRVELPARRLAGDQPRHGGRGGVRPRRLRPARGGRRAVVTVRVRLPDRRAAGVRPRSARGAPSTRTPPTSLELAQRKTTERAFNWKLLLENYSENFHTPWVHPQLTWQQWEYPIVADGPVVLAWDRPLAPAGSRRGGAGPRHPDRRGLAARWPTTQIDEVFLAGAYFTVFPNLLVSMFPRYLSAFWLHPGGGRPHVGLVRADVAPRGGRRAPGRRPRRQRGGGRAGPRHLRGAPAHRVGRDRSAGPAVAASTRTASSTCTSSCAGRSAGTR